MTARKKAAHPASRAADLPAAVVPAPQAVPIAQQDQEAVRKAEAVVAQTRKESSKSKVYRCAQQSFANRTVQAFLFSSENSDYGTDQDLTVAVSTSVMLVRSRIHCSGGSDLSVNGMFLRRQSMDLG